MEFRCDAHLAHLCYSRPQIISYDSWGLCLSQQSQHLSCERMHGRPTETAFNKRQPTEREEELTIIQ